MSFQRLLSDKENALQDGHPSNKEESNSHQKSPAPGGKEYLKLNKWVSLNEISVQTRCIATGEAQQSSGVTKHNVLIFDAGTLIPENPHYFWTLEAS